MYNKTSIRIFDIKKLIRVKIDILDLVIKTYFGQKYQYK